MFLLQCPSVRSRMNLVRLRPWTSFRASFCPQRKLLLWPSACLKTQFSVELPRWGANCVPGERFYTANAITTSQSDGPSTPQPQETGTANPCVAFPPRCLGRVLCGVVGFLFLSLPLNYSFEVFATQSLIRHSKSFSVTPLPSPCSAFIVCPCPLIGWCGVVLY